MSTLRAASFALALQLSLFCGLAATCPKGDQRSECLRRKLAVGNWDGDFTRPKCRRFTSFPRTFEKFFEKVLTKGVPVVFQNASAIFGPRVEQWGNLTRFKAKFGKTRHPTSIYNSQVNRPGQGMDTSAGDGVDRFGITPVNGGRHLWRPYSKKQTMKEVLENEDAARMSFIESGILFMTDTEEADGKSTITQEKMYKEWRKPACVGPIKHTHVNVWAGRTFDRPKETPLHYDPADNIFLNLVGKKKFTMFSALFTANLYPSYMDSRHAPKPDDFTSFGRDEREGKESDNFSPIDPERPDRKRFPDFKNAKATVCELGPGDALFMPSYTWHNVLSSGDNDSKVSLGVNAWFKPAETRFAALHELVKPLIMQEPHSVKGGSSAKKRKDEL